MATIYALNGETISEGLQGSMVCDEAINAALTKAEDRGEPVVLEDDDGIWLVSPDGKPAQPYVWP